MRTALYRHFNAAGDLLYVGISLNAVNRLIAHTAGSKWAHEIASVEIEYFDDRDLALDAEYIAIISEKPKFNGTYNRPKASAAIISKKPKAFFANDNDVSEIPLEKIEWDNPQHAGWVLGVRYSLFYPACWVLEYRIGDAWRRRSLGPTTVVSRIAVGAMARVLFEKYGWDPTAKHSATFAAASLKHHQDQPAVSIR